MFGSISFGMFLVMAAYAGDPVDDARKGFNNCLVRYTVEQLGLKTTPNAFKRAVKTSCTPESKAFRDIIVSEEVKIGESKSDAETYADEEVQMIVDGFINSYPRHAADRTAPVEEK